MKYIGSLFLIFIIACCSEEPIKSNGCTPLNDPEFTVINNEWSQSYLLQEMDEIWSLSGIDRKGNNYYYLPVSQNSTGCSERFNPLSKYFQSWFGIYTVEDNAAGTYSLASGIPDEVDIFNLAIADQKAWLTNFALMDSPVVKIDSSVNISNESIVIEGVVGWHLSGRLVSNVDVGDNNQQEVPELFSIERSIWENEVTSYQAIHLDVNAFIWYSPENMELNVAYYNGIRYTNKNDSTISTIDSIRVVMEEMVYGIRTCK